MYLINTPLTCTFSACTFVDNTAGSRGGVFYGYNIALNAVDCLMKSNDATVSGGAVTLINNWPSSMSGCTIVQNGAATGGGISCEAAGQLSVSNTLISLSTSGGGAAVDGNSTLTFSCSDIFGNGGGDWLGALAAQNGTNGNFSLDPFFCEPSTMDFTLGENSPCLPGQHPNGDQCGRIGAFGEGCGGIAVHHTSWGHIKAIYSE